MKADQLFEGDQRIPVTVPFEITVDAHGGIDYHRVQVSGYVSPIDTTSPPEYEFIPMEIVDTTTRQRVMFTTLSDDDWKEVDALAISTALGIK